MTVTGWPGRKQEAQKQNQAGVDPAVIAPMPLAVADATCMCYQCYSQQDTPYANGTRCNKGFCAYLLLLPALASCSGCQQQWEPPQAALHKT
jgi:hypothetical protein